MPELPDTMLNRFFALVELGRDGPFTVELRGLFRERPVQNSVNLREMELAIYANDIQVGKRVAVDTAENKAGRLDALMGEILRESVLFGLFVMARQTQTLDEDFPDTRPLANWLCPPRLGLSNVIEGELLPPK